MTLHPPQRLPRVTVALLPRRDDGHSPTKIGRREHETREPGPATGVALSVVLVLIILGQRFSVPVGSFALPVLVLVAHAAGALLLATRLVVVNKLRAQIFSASVAFCLVTTYMAGWSSSRISMASLALLVALYLPWLLTVRPQDRTGFHRVAQTFVWTMMALSVIGVAQMLGQVTGVWEWTDYLHEWVPEQYLVSGFNTSNPIGYLSPIHKATAFVVLEPSFLSQFCALALLVGVVRHAPTWQLVVLAAGMAATISGTGIMLLCFGLLIVAVRVPSVIKPGYVVGSLLVLVGVLATPVFDLLLERTDEFSEQGSSGYMRFVQPYSEVARAMAADPVRYLVGAGPGAADRLLTSARLHAGEAVVYTIPAKLVFEYGLIAGGSFVVFLLVAVLSGRPLPALPASLVFMTFLLSGALLQPHTAYLAWLLSSVWGDEPRDLVSRAARPPTSAQRLLRAQVPDP